MIFASSRVGRRGAIRTPVPSRIRRVAPAIAARVVTGSSQGSLFEKANFSQGYASVFGPIARWSGSAI